MVTLPLLSDSSSLEGVADPSPLYRRLGNDPHPASFGKPKPANVRVSKEIVWDIDYYLLKFPISYLQQFQELATSRPLEVKVLPNWLQVVTSPVIIMVPPMFKSVIMRILQNLRHPVVQPGGDGLLSKTMTKTGNFWHQVLHRAGLTHVFITSWGQRMEVLEFFQRILPYAVKSDFNQVDIAKNTPCHGIPLYSLGDPAAKVEPQLSVYARGMAFRSYPLLFRVGKGCGAFDIMSPMRRTAVSGALRITQYPLLIHFLKAHTSSLRKAYPSTTSVRGKIHHMLLELYAQLLNTPDSYLSGGRFEVTFAISGDPNRWTPQLLKTKSDAALASVLRNHKKMARIEVPIALYKEQCRLALLMGQENGAFSNSQSKQTEHRGSRF